MIDEERFQRDLRAFQIITPLFVNLGYELLKKVKVIELLKNEKSIEELSAEASVRNVALLETILDILVGAKVLNFSKNKYKYAMPPKKMRAEDMEFLNKHYGRSLEWVNKLIKSSDGCLLHNKCDFSLGFEGEKMLDLWDDIMNESPYSLRKYAISLFNEKLQGKEKILDYGCGGGIALEQILLSVDKEITLYGMDPSKKYLNRAKKRIDNLQKKTKDKLVLENIKRMRFIHFNPEGGIPKNEKYDVIFISIVLNHIDEKDHPKLFRNLKSILNQKGKLVICQLINQSRFQRMPIWVMHVIPTHKGYPYKDSYIKNLKKVFPKVEIFFDGSVSVSGIS